VTIVRTGGLGDTILVLPTFEIVRLVYPSATFTLVGSAWAEALQPLLPFAVRAINIDRVFPPPRHGAEAANLFAASHAVVVYTATPESDLVSHARCVCPGPVVVWPVAPPAGIHAVQHLASAIVSVPSDLDALPRPTLRCPRELRIRVREWLDQQFGRGVRPVAVHPGSGGRRKCWPAHRFAEVAFRLDAPILLIEGPADSDACRDVTEGLAPSVPAVRATGESLSSVAALLMESRAYVGNDSGVSHLAAALGVPTIAVFGPTDPTVWAPLGPKVAVVAPQDDAPWPAVDNVFVAVCQWLGEGAPGVSV
jgi:ADP-heptose:LPS heptosyltransferase